MVLPHYQIDDFLTISLVPTPEFGSLKYIEYNMIQNNLLTMIYFRDIDNT